MTSPIAPIRIEVPGRAQAQERRGVVTKGGRIHNYDPKRSREWKAYAAECMLAEVMKRGFSKPAYPDGPVRVVITIVFPLPKGARRKGSPVQRTWRSVRPDFDNVEKAVCDAARGVLWRDDSQVADCRTRKFTAGQDNDPPGVYVTVDSLDDDADGTAVWGAFP